MEVVISLLSRLARPIVILCVFLTVLFLVVRPAIAWLAEFASRQARQPAKEGDGQPTAPDAELEHLLEEAKEAEMTPVNQERIRRLAATDPERAKELVRSWLHQS